MEILQLIADLWFIAPLAVIALLLALSS